MVAIAAILLARGQDLQSSLLLLGMFALAAVRMIPSTTRLSAALGAGSLSLCFDRSYLSRVARFATAAVGPAAGFGRGASSPNPVPTGARARTCVLFLSRGASAGDRRCVHCHSERALGRPSSVRPAPAKPPSPISSWACWFPPRAGSSWTDTICTTTLPAGSEISDMSRKPSI